MANLKTFSKLSNILLPFPDFLYILQLEEYSTMRLIKWFPKFFFRRNIQQREKLILTKRALITLLLSFGKWLLFGIFGVYLCKDSLFALLFFLIFLFVVSPIFVLTSNFLFSLYEEIPKKKLRELATNKRLKNDSMKVVTIAGSYGKTTVKNFLFQLTRHTYKTQMIPGNINTPGGIANWIIGNLQEGTQLLISEVDAYEIGEIAKSCDILKADLAILTNVGDQHVERFGNERNLATALSEVFTHAKSGAVCLSDENTKLKITDLVSEQEIKIIKTQEDFRYQRKLLPSPNLSTSNLTNLHFALAIAEELNISKAFVSDTISHLELPERRQQETNILGYEGIDDSYNISFATAKAGILTAKSRAAQKKKKLLVITAGIPELSRENQGKNQELGRFLAQNADHSIVLNSMFSSEILKGAIGPKDFTLISTLRNFIQVNARDYDPNEWYLLLQPELNDLYY